MQNASTSCTEEESNIFLVDEDADDRKFFSDALEELAQNIPLSHFSSGEEVLADLRSGTPLPEIV